MSIVITYRNGEYQEIDNIYGLNDTYSELNTPMIVAKTYEDLKRIGINPEEVKPKKPNNSKFRDFCVPVDYYSKHKVLTHAFRLGYLYEIYYQNQHSSSDRGYIHFNSEGVCFFRFDHKISRYSNIPIVNIEDFYKEGNFTEEMSEKEEAVLWTKSMESQHPIQKKINSTPHLRSAGNIVAQSKESFENLDDIDWTKINWVIKELPIR